MAAMSDRFMRAASFGAAANGFFSNMPPQAQQLLETIGTKLGIDLNGNGARATNGHEPDAAGAETESAAAAPSASAAPGSKKSKPDA